jgi:hypothetical protein
MLAGGAYAEVVRVAEPQYSGEIDRNGKEVHLKWSTEVALAPDEVVRRLTRWSEAERFVSGVTSVKLEKTEGGAAILRVDRDMPFFLPEVWIRVRADQQRKDGVWTIHWRVLEGTMKSYDRVWHVRTAPGGARVDHAFVFEMPFDVPNLFAKGRMRRQLVEDFEQLHALTGGGVAKAPAKP